MKKTGQLPASYAPRALKFTRPPAPVAGLIFGRLLLDEWTPKIGWLCACLCGCGEYEIVRTTQLVATTALRACTHSGRNRPQDGLSVRFRDGRAVLGDVRGERGERGERG